MDDDNARHAQIEVRAYTLWTQSGQPEGKAEEFWNLAKAQIDSEEQPVGLTGGQELANETAPLPRIIEPGP
jgi:hypothetical protein